MGAESDIATEVMTERDVVRTANETGSSPFVLLCDHASRRVPARYGDLGLTEAELSSHIAWDPGALAVSRQLSEMLDAPLVYSTVSRLVIDCNRRLDAPDLIWTLSETTRIAANEGLGEVERQNRVDRYYRPYHKAVSDLLDRRQSAGQESVLVCVHSFTPVYKGVARRWPVGLIHGRDPGFTRRVFDALGSAESELEVGWNEPYSASDGVTFTLEHHGDARGLESVMVEIRNDGIGDAAGVARWAGRFAGCLEAARLAQVPEAAQQGE